MAKSNIIQRVSMAWDVLKDPTKANLFNRAFYGMLGNTATAYSTTLDTLITKGFGENPDVFAIINQQASKSMIVPYAIKDVEDEMALSKIKSYPIDSTFQQKLAINKLKKKAYKTDSEKPMPLDKPNPLQSWSDIIYLYKVYMQSCGNAYFYMVSPTEGMNAGVPQLVYMLPAQWTQIVLKSNANMLSVESPIDYYIMQQGNQYIKFPADNIIHIKRPNPFFDNTGSHLYGLSPLMAAIRNINSSNSTIDENVKASQNRGVYGFMHAGDGQSPLTSEQAKELKDRLVEMDNSEAKLSNIAGASAKIGFTRISLNTAEFKPFDYLSNDRNTLANCLNWNVDLLNETHSSQRTGFGTDTLIEARKRVMIDNIKPDLDLLASYFNSEFIQKFKGYEKSEIEFDITEMPEMQTDMKTMAEWINKVPLSANERRAVFNYEEIEGDLMNEIYIPTGLVNINDPSVNDMLNGQTTS